MGGSRLLENKNSFAIHNLTGSGYRGITLLIIISSINNLMHVIKNDRRIIISARVSDEEQIYIYLMGSNGEGNILFLNLVFAVPVNIPGTTKDDLEIILKFSKPSFINGLKKINFQFPIDYSLIQNLYNLSNDIKVTLKKKAFNEIIVQYFFNSEIKNLINVDITKLF